MPIPMPDVLVHGYSMVSLFLVLSGYLATVQFQKKYDEQKFHVIARKEFVNKWYRLTPLMWGWILISFFVGNVIMLFGGSYGDLPRWGNELKAALMLNYNYYLAGLDIGGVFGQFWTLYVEIHFYIIFVLLFALVRNKKARLWISVAVCALITFVLRPMTPTKIIRYATHTQIDALFIGVIIGLVGNKLTFLDRIPLWVKRIVGWVLVLLLAMGGFHFDHYLNDPVIRYPVFTLLAGLILLLAVRNEGVFSCRGAVDKVLGWIGDASASVYVSHVLLYSCVYAHIYYNTTLIPEVIKQTWWGQTIQIIGLLVTACLVGRVSLHFIEQPYIRYGRSRAEKIQ